MSGLLIMIYRDNRSLEMEPVLVVSKISEI